MAGDQSARGGARLSENIGEFMQRRREVEHLGSAAEAAAHEAVGKAIRAGQDYRLATPSEVMAYGTKLLRGDERRPAARPTRAPSSNTPKPRVRDSGPVKAFAGTIAQGAGLLPGMARGVLHTAEGAADASHFALRLANPSIDMILSPPGHSAPEEVLGVGRKVGDYAASAIQDPSILRRDLDAAARDFSVKQNPSATPVGDTLGEEVKRRFNLGLNNGELAFDVGSMFVGGEAIRGAAGLGKAAKAADAAELSFLEQNPGIASPFERSYPKTGMSHHIIERAAKLPKLLGGGRYPKKFIESEFNKIQHNGISYRDQYRNHRGVGGDRHFTGARIPREFGEGGFRTSDLGWDTYGPIDRLRYGTSPATKAVVGPVLLVGPADSLIQQGDAP